MKGRFLDEFRRCLVGLSDLFFERDCAVCGGPLASGGQFVCRQCLDDMPLTYFWTYSENAAMERLFEADPGESGNRPAYGCRIHNAAALFFYRHESPWCEIVRRFKYGRRESLGLWASRMLGDYLAGGGLYGDVQAVVPVPLHWFKRWKRGFNQAEIIARGVAERLGTGRAGDNNPAACDTADRAAAASTSGETSSDDTSATPRSLPVETRLLRRVRYTSTQTRRGASSRRQNIRGAFAVNPKAVARLKASGVRHLLLVDDVLTTGATLSECVRLLQDHFTVSVATLGFVE